VTFGSEWVTMVEASLEARKKTAFRMLDGIFNKGILIVIDETCSKNIIVHASRSANDIKGIKAFEDYVKGFLEAFADIHLHVDDLHAEGDTVDVHATFTATNITPFHGMPATKEEVTTAPVFFFKFGPDGKIAEHWQENLL
jgi:predicted ester cyclase